MWKELIEQKSKWVGGILFDEDQDSEQIMHTKLCDIRFNGIEHGYDREEDWIAFVGEDFSCGAWVGCLGLSCEPQHAGEMLFTGNYGLRFRIQKRRLDTERKKES